MPLLPLAVLMPLLPLLTVLPKTNPRMGVSQNPTAQEAQPSSLWQQRVLVVAVVLCGYQENSKSFTGEKKEQIYQKES